MLTVIGGGYAVKGWCYYNHLYNYVIVA